jgi:hypothetical protein
MEKNPAGGWGNGTGRGGRWMAPTAGTILVSLRPCAVTLGRRCPLECEKMSGAATASMPPAFVIHVDAEALRQYGRRAVLRNIADRARLARRAAVARPRAILPWPIRMGLTNPAGVGAVRAEAHAILIKTAPSRGHCMVAARPAAGRLGVWIRTGAGSTESLDLS